MDNLFALGIICSAFATWYFIRKKPNKRSRNISIGILIISFILLGITVPKENESVEKNPDISRENSTIISTTRSSLSEPKILELVIESRLESDEEGLILISGTTKPNATVKIGTISEITSDSEGYFEYNYALTNTSNTSVKVSVDKDGIGNYSYVDLIASGPFISKKAEEIRIADEEAKKAEELAAQTAEAFSAVAAAEANLTRENYEAALASVNGLPAHNSDLTARLNAIDENIRNQEVQAAAELQQEEALQEQTNEQTVLVTKTGAHYHTRKCGNGTYTPASLEAAQSMGLTPCSKCFG
ncbi:hypothetical protein [Enterococcus sp. BWB1-3]|uniref:hypothetical protein n=1 Tax=Enterococcus sp. BWB1-3 TaxID=2787713 RepID=UPI001F176C28|nr:hypothetical protein [Enterococcus sp. BWB1-3]